MLSWACPPPWPDPPKLAANNLTAHAAGISVARLRCLAACRIAAFPGGARELQASSGDEFVSGPGEALTNSGAVIEAPRVPFAIIVVGQRVGERTHTLAYVTFVSIR